MNQNSQNQNEFLAEYSSFVNSSDEALTEFQKGSVSDLAKASERKEILFQKVKEDLNPSFAFVFRKMLFIQTITGLLTLVVCPQFGIGAFGKMGLLHFFMAYGEIPCRFLCGGLFIAVSFLVAPFVLTKEETKVVKASLSFYALLLTLTCYAIFFLVSNEARNVSGLEWTKSFWILGGVILSRVAFRLTNTIKSTG